MKERNLIFDNLRGICMLGVIAIHVGSFVMDSATPSEHYLLLCEVLSRYSVPAFFFISGYGLFYSYPLEKPFAYLHFLKKRLWSIGIPYLLFSFFYIWLEDQNYPNPHMWDLDPVLFKLSFGTAIYHIYFLVILMWFYICFPLWRQLMKLLEKVGVKISLPVLFLLQVWLYKASAHFWSYPNWVNQADWIYNLCQYRLNYFPFFYLFIFMLGGLIARHYKIFLSYITNHAKLIILCFLLSASANSAIFYRYIYKWEMDIESTVNVLQQLSLPGLVYTITSLFFFSWLLNRYQHLPWLERISQRSFLIYLVHPAVMQQLIYQLLCLGIVFKQVPLPAFYFAILIISYLLAEVLHQLVVLLKKPFRAKRP